jgi:hypothetical protein
MKHALLGTVALTALSFVQTPALASSHREAPMIAGIPKLDATDFYMFRSYESGRSAYVTLVANYLPLQDVYGGPNFFNLDHNGYYDINIDNQGAGTPTYSLRFRFSQATKNLALNIGGTSVPIPLINDGAITATNSSAQNVVEQYTVALVTYSGGTATEHPLKDGSGNAVFTKPVDNIGDKSIANYAEYAAHFIYTVQIPGCGGARIFVGQRKDPFVVNLGETFVLVNYANPVGEQYDASAKDDLAEKNVTAIEAEIPAACLTNGSDPVIGGWTASYRADPGPSNTVTYERVSRLGNPLVNELVIGLPDKDKFNGSVPIGDPQFAKYVTNPTVPALIQALFGTAAPTAFPREDLVAVFLTGLKGLNAPKQLAGPAEEMRLNTSTPITAYGKQSRLGVIGGDNAGYPNGRRPGDDVVDITLRVAMGRLYTLGLFGKPSDAPSGNLDFTDGAYTDDTHYDQTFPYLKAPLSGSPQPVHEPS